MPDDLPRAARTLLAAWDANRARVGDLLVSEAVLAAVEGIRVALPPEPEPEEPPQREVLALHCPECGHSFAADFSVPVVRMVRAGAAAVTCPRCYGHAREKQA